MQLPNGASVRRRTAPALAALGVAAAAMIAGATGEPGRWKAADDAGRRLAAQWVPRWVSGLVPDPAPATPSAALQPAPAAPAAARALPRAQADVASWIAKRYGVAAGPVVRVVEEAWAIGRREALEPTLILAIVAIESSFNPFAQSPVGAQGLMQVMTRVHLDKFAPFGGARAAFDPVSNLRVGVRVLVECIERAGSVEQGLRHYVGAARLPDDGGYAAKVLAEQAQLKRVVAGRAVPAAPRGG